MIKLSLIPVSNLIWSFTSTITKLFLSNLIVVFVVTLFFQTFRTIFFHVFVANLNILLVTTTWLIVISIILVSYRLRGIFCRYCRIFPKRRSIDNTWVYEIVSFLINYTGIWLFLIYWGFGKSDRIYFTQLLLLIGRVGSSSIIILE